MNKWRTGSDDAVGSISELRRDIASSIALKHGSTSFGFSRELGLGLRAAEINGPVDE